MRPIICAILGHVDVGKTSLLDKISNKNISNFEDGSITQSIRLIPVKKSRIESLIGNVYNNDEIIFVDTPGHSGFDYTRNIALEVCDVVILILDILKGVEKETANIINTLKDNKKPFIILLNKLDKIYEWKNSPNAGFRKNLENQTSPTIKQFEDRIKTTIYDFAIEEINVDIYYKIKNLKEYACIVPISSITGEGLKDLFRVLETFGSKLLEKRLQTNNEKTTGYIVDRTNHKIFGELYIIILLDGNFKIGDRIIFYDKKLQVVKTEFILVKQ